ncbi:enoyl-CoA hydratase-related protein, partial [Vibrio parahaemolyticus]
LTGAGRGFCAEQDLSDGVFTPGETPDLSMPIEKYYNPLVRKLRSIPMPAVCAVNGVAAGAGANVALACDIVIAARSAKFIQAFAKLG